MLIFKCEDIEKYKKDILESFLIDGWDKFSLKKFGDIVNKKWKYDKNLFFFCIIDGNNLFYCFIE